MRTTANDVREIMEETELTDTTINSYITSANLLVTQTLINSGLSVDLLAEIERWLTAHMIVATRERLSVKEEAGGAKIEYAGKFGEGLKATSYGQMVLTLDTTGALASLGMQRASMHAIKE